MKRALLGLSVTLVLSLNWAGCSKEMEDRYLYRALNVHDLSLTIIDNDSVYFSVRGFTPDPCWEIFGIKQDLVKDTLDLELRIRREKGKDCIAMIGVLDTTLAFPLSALPVQNLYLRCRGDSVKVFGAFSLR